MASTVDECANIANEGAGEIPRMLAHVLYAQQICQIWRRCSSSAQNPWAPTWSRAERRRCTSESHRFGCRNSETFCLPLGRTRGQFSFAASRDIPSASTSTNVGSGFPFKRRGGRIFSEFRHRLLPKSCRAGQRRELPKKFNSPCRRGRTIISGGQPDVGFTSVGQRTEELDSYMDRSGYTTGYTTSAEYPSNRAHNRAGPPVE